MYTDSGAVVLGDLYIISSYDGVVGRDVTAEKLPEEKLRMDLMYILRPSVVEDLRIMMATLKVLFLPESAEAAAEGQSAAMQKLSGRDERGKAASGF